MSSASRISDSPKVEVRVRAALPNHGEVTVVLGDQGRQQPFGYNSSGLPSSWHSHKKKNTSRSGHHFPGASRQERERRAGGCERGAMPAQPGAASCQQPPAVPTISVLCGTCEKALPFLSHAAAAAAAGPLGPEWTEPRGHRRGSQMCAGWLGVYWHTVRLIRIGPGWHCSIN